MQKLVLASSSPRRIELLSLFGVAFETIAADVDETSLQGESPGGMTLRLATLKVEHIYQTLGPGHAVLGGDTTVAIDGHTLGKPADRMAAIEMLERLSGRQHEVISGVALKTDESTATRCSRTAVRFGKLSRRQIELYCDSGEPYDKAGGYGIQGLAGAYVEEITGSHSGVVGLPLFETRQLLESAGLIP